MLCACFSDYQRNHPRPSTGTIQVKKSGDAVVCHSTDKIADVMQKLIVEGFLSLPVLSVHDGRFIGEEKREGKGGRQG